MTISEPSDSSPRTDDPCPHSLPGHAADTSAPTGRAAVFLDRDGVINIDDGYTHRPDHFVFMPGIFEICRAAQREGFRLVIVTNQAGIGRGYYDVAAFALLTQWMLERFAQERIHVDRVYFCPHHPQSGLGPYRRDCDYRKPNPGMLQAACADLDLDPTRCIFIGDKPGDMVAGASAGVARLALLSSEPCELPGHVLIRKTSLPELQAALFPSVSGN